MDHGSSECVVAVAVAAVAAAAAVVGSCKFAGETQETTWMDLLAHV